MLTDIAMNLNLLMCSLLAATDRTLSISRLQIDCISIRSVSPKMGVFLYFCVALVPVYLWIQVDLLMMNAAALKFVFDNSTAL
jgi:hypothetical protein